MESYNKVILSIGSNQGDRLKHLTRCIELINNQIGTVIQVSKAYQSPAWGFVSEPFYNAALLVHTPFTANQVLQQIVAIEQQLGRVRGQNSGYEARTIDVDIITFNDDIVATESLQIPHPQMQNRLFVLVPMQDLKTDWQHPALNQSINQLIAACADDSQLEVVATMPNPNQAIELHLCNYIAIEGNIGAGKTTLSTRISEDFNAKLILERFADNPFLPKFYNDPARYAFPLEVSFLTDRYKQLSDDLSQFDLFKDFVVSDYHIFKSLIFAKVTLPEDEYMLYKNMFDIMYKEMPKPDLYVYLYQNPERLLTNIKLRGRSYEQDIKGEYLDRINQGYLDFIKTHTELNSLIIDVSAFDFVNNQQDYISILNLIQNKLKERTN
ncbi:2-amino-4-hydroxy-6-hydroxymethyldihydropteridine diphosphokinase [Flavobacterium agricola]|uniref:2-amino-4-hydroxy-6-hydroxymethyldihydropteridine pyrophosphokinase n=1 Tax=Flavobacterium agricola TaxID=2870839 RepID=A0ABY6LWH8_9FLAO|nr:2-amino-4-hydroxy-6-hydroxymethyldihydropteridine diphosphokinase [Flavobacterium agricola]UYW00693.1 2-amino-4-hydroxy-6-hydroxymethyldihydropteridine diphosphokinase [Flavobacterium agricola]